MGMFDTIYVKDQEGIRDGDYQSKDLDCLLDEYTITNNRLIQHYKEYEWVEDDSRLFGGRLTPVFEEDRDTNFHGWLNFYSPTNDGWVDYHVKFTDGELVEIKEEWSE